MALTQEDLQAIQALLEPINKRLDSVEESQQTIRNSQMRVELEQFPRIAAALDGFKSNKEKNDEQDERIIFLEKKTDNHDIRIYAVEQAVKAK